MNICGLSTYWLSGRVRDMTTLPAVYLALVDPLSLLYFTLINTGVFLTLFQYLVLCVFWFLPLIYIICQWTLFYSVNSVSQITSKKVISDKPWLQCFSTFS